MFREKPTDPIATNLACPAFYVLRNSSLPLVRCPRLSLAHPEYSLSLSAAAAQRRPDRRVLLLPTAPREAARGCSAHGGGGGGTRLRTGLGVLGAAVRRR
jgi:hypothetical protein